MKVGVAIADLMTGTYATIGILAALDHRRRTGRGQRSTWRCSTPRWPGCPTPASTT